MFRKILWMAGGAGLVCLVAGGIYLGWAKIGGSLDSPEAVAHADSRMYSLLQIYKYLTTYYDETWTHADLTKQTGFTEPGAGPTGGTMYTLDDVAGALVRFPATGQTTSTETGDDGYLEMGATKSYSKYQIGDDWVTEDLNTGLMWASDGNAAGCAGGAAKNWSAALSWADALTFAGYSDWRLPNIYELYSIVILEPGGDYIDTTNFPNTDLGGYPYWSSTTVVANATRALIIDYSSAKLYGDSSPDGNKTTAMPRVRAVRGGY